MNVSSVMSCRTLRITLLADEWKSSKGGLSTMNRELAIQLARHPNVAVTFFVPKCTEDDKKAASSHNVNIFEAKERSGFESIYWLCFPPSDLFIDIIIGHGVKLGKQAQVIRESHHCTWVQVVHTAPEELAMYKPYSGAISKGDEKQWTEVNLCKIADLVVAVGPKLHEFYSAYLSSCGKNVFHLTPGIFTELSTLKLSTKETKRFRVLVFGRGDSEDFELKGFDIAAKAVAELNDRSYQLVFVGAPSGNETQVAEKLLEQGLNRNQLTVKGYLEKRDDLAMLLSTANLAIIPSRTEGFGLTALEALSAGLPFLVSQNSGFGEALQEIPFGSSWIVDSEDPAQWAEAIKGVREKGRETALKECQELRTRYAKKFSWEKQCNDLVEMMAPLVNRSEVDPAVFVPSQKRNRAENETSENNAQEEQTLATSKGEGSQRVSIERTEHLTGVSKDKREMPQSVSASLPEGNRLNGRSVRTSTRRNPLQEDQSAIEQRREGSSRSYIRSVTAKHSEGARPKETSPSSTGNTKPKVSAREVEPAAVVAPLQSRSRASDGKSQQNVEEREEESLTASKDKLEVSQLGSAIKTEGKLETCESGRPLRSPLQGDLSATKPRREGAMSFHICEATLNLESSNSNRGARPKEIITPLSTRRTKVEDLAILGCNVSRESMQAVMKVFAEIAPKLNLAEYPPVENLQPDEAKRYLTSNCLKFCVLVVDVNIIRVAYKNQLRQTYKELLETAANEVAAKVIVLVCDDVFLPPNDQTVVHETIDHIITKRGKGFTAWLNHGKLAVDPDVLVELISPISAEPQRNPQTTGVSEGFEKSTTRLDKPQGYQMRNPSEWETRGGWNEQPHIQQPQDTVAIAPATTTSYTGYITPLRKPVMLKSKLRNGYISYQPGDLDILYPDFKVPDPIREGLLNAHGNIPEAGLEIVKDINGELRIIVEPKSKDSSKDREIEIAANKTVMLETRVHYGKVSFEKGDLRFLYPNFQIPAYITTSLKRDYETVPDGELYVFSDHQGKLRYKVQLERMDKARGYANKVWRKVTHFKS